MGTDQSRFVFTVRFTTDDGEYDVFVNETHVGRSLSRNGMAYLVSDYIHYQIIEALNASKEKEHD